jgi:plastocyanin
MPLWRRPIPLAVAALGYLCAASAADQTVRITDELGRPLADAVVYALPDTAAQARPHTKAIIDQIKKQFAPRISVLQTGTEVDFPNSDNIRHSVYSFSRPKPFTLKLYAGKPAAPILFDNPGIVVLGCNIHDRMAAWVVVVDTPYFGQTTATGVMTLHDLPEGHYRLVAWYPGLPDAGESRELKAGPVPGPVQDFSLAVKPLAEQEL